MSDIESPSTPRRETERRVAALQIGLTRAGIDAAFIVQRIDLFYFSGTAQEGHLVVPAKGDPILLVRKNFERARAESSLTDVRKADSLASIVGPAEEVCSGRPRTLAMELDILPVTLYNTYKKLFPYAEIQNASPLIREIRSVKSAYEIELIERAGRLGDEMFARVADELREGLTEMEFAGRLEAFLRARGHQGHCRVRAFNQEVFYGHIMSGVNLAVPGSSPGPTCGPGPNASMPQGAGRKVIRRGEPVQIDYLSAVDGYMVDQARTFFLGEPADIFLRVHEVALNIQRRLSESGVPGAKGEDLYQEALDIARSSGCEQGFMGYPEPVPFVGHGIGLEVDEFPIIGRASHILEEGMVVALEPKFILPNRGLAGIENTFVVTSKGLRKLTHFDDEIKALP